MQLTIIIEICQSAKYEASLYGSSEKKNVENSKNVIKISDSGS
jgi:hypothetical protein